MTTQTQLDRFLSDARRLSRNASSATATAVAGGEMMKAASDVIAARLEILATGLADPRKTDLTEISLMSSEKVEAMSESAATLGRNFGALGERLSHNASEEMRRASKAVSAMAGAASPQAFVAVQYDYALAWWSRAVLSQVSARKGTLSTSKNGSSLP